MKYILILALLTTVGCTSKKNPFISTDQPVFKIGDCVEKLPNPNVERWEAEKSDMVYKIKELGKKKYRTEVFFYRDMNSSVSSSLDYFIQDLYTKIDCPEGL